MVSNTAFYGTQKYDLKYKYKKPNHMMGIYV